MNIIHVILLFLLAGTLFVQQLTERKKSLQIIVFAYILLITAHLMLYKYKGNL